METKEHNEVSQQRVLEELAAIGFANISDYIKVEKGVPVLKSSRQRPAVASIEKTSTGLKVKLYDKLKALELLGRHIGMFDGSEHQEQDSNLLQALLEATKEEVDTGDLPELQQAANAGDDLVEPTGTEGM